MLVSVDFTNSLTATGLRGRAFEKSLRDYRLPFAAAPPTREVLARELLLRMPLTTPIHNALPRFWGLFWLRDGIPEGTGLDPERNPHAAMGKSQSADNDARIC